MEKLALDIMKDRLGNGPRLVHPSALADFIFSELEALSDSSDYWQASRCLYGFFKVGVLTLDEYDFFICALDARYLAIQ